MRDTLLGHYPLTWVADPFLLFWVIGAALLTIAFARFMAALRWPFLHPRRGGPRDLHRHRLRRRARDGAVAGDRDRRGDDHRRRGRRDARRALQRRAAAVLVRALRHGLDRHRRRLLCRRCCSALPADLAVVIALLVGFPLRMLAIVYKIEHAEVHLRQGHAMSGKPAAHAAEPQGRLQPAGGVARRSTGCRRSGSRGPGRGATPSPSRTRRRRYGLDPEAAQAKAVALCGELAAGNTRPKAVARRSAVPRGDPQRTGRAQSCLLVQTGYAVPCRRTDRTRERMSRDDPHCLPDQHRFRPRRAQGSGRRRRRAWPQAAAAGRRSRRGRGWPRRQGDGLPACRDRRSSSIPRPIPRRAR